MKILVVTYVSSYLNEKLVFKWWHVTITLFTFRRFRFRVAFFRNITSLSSSQHCVVFVFATLRRFRLRNIASLSSSQHCVAFVFATLRRFRLRNNASLSSSQHCVAFVFATLRRFRLRNIASLSSSQHLILIARYEALAKISYISTSHTNSSVRSPRKNLIHLILIARYGALAKIPYTLY